jgi:acyl-CoA thioester hydrolase
MGNDDDGRKPVTPADFAVTRGVATRWADTDIYGHINNAVYTQLFDTAINGWLIENCAFDPATAPAIGVVVNYTCTYYREIRFPQALIVGVRVASIGRSSVTYDVALFDEPDTAESVSQAAAQANWVHVYVDREGRRPVAIPADIRSVLEANYRPAVSAVLGDGD